MKRRVKVTVTRPGKPLFEFVTVTYRGVGSLLTFIHRSIPDADFVIARIA